MGGAETKLARPVHHVKPGLARRDTVQQGAGPVGRMIVNDQRDRSRIDRPDAIQQRLDIIDLVIGRGKDDDARRPALRIKTCQLDLCPLGEVEGSRLGRPPVPPIQGRRTPANASPMRNPPSRADLAEDAPACFVPGIFRP